MHLASFAPILPSTLTMHTDLAEFGHIPACSTLAYFDVAGIWLKNARFGLA
jgi:hypothetical protein